MKLLGEWTKRNGRNWPIKFVHSAGIAVRNQSDCVEILESMKMTIPMSHGGKSPNDTAMKSLFENRRFNSSSNSGIASYIYGV